MAGEVDQLLVRIDASTEALRRQLKRAERDISGFERSADRNVAAVEGRFQRMGATLSRSLGGIGVALGGAAIGREILGTITQFEALDQRIRTLTGTTEAYDEAQNYLRETSNRLATDLAATTDQYGRLLTLQNSGLITNQQARALLEGFADAAAATGAETGQLNQVMYGLSQALSSGTVRAEEFNQVTEPMPGLLQAMERAAGLSAGGLRKLVNEGEVTSEMFGRIMVAALQEFAGEAEKRADTIGGKWQILNNRWTDLQRSLAQPVTDVLAPILGTATELLAKMDPLIKSLIEINRVAASVTQLPFKALGEIGERTGLLAVNPDERRADLTRERANLLDTIQAREAAGGKFSADIVADARRRLNVIDAELEALKGAVYGPGQDMVGPAQPPAQTLNLGTITIPGAKPKPNGRSGGTRGKSEAEKAADEAKRAAEREAEAIRSVTDALAFEQEQITRTAREQEIYNQLRAAGIDTNHEAAAGIIDLAGKVYDLEKASQDLNDLIQDDPDGIFGMAPKKVDEVTSSVGQLGQAMLGGLQHALVSVGGNFKNLEQVAVAAISHIITELIRMQQTAEAAGKSGPLSNLFGGGGGGGGDIFGTIVSGISGFFGGGGATLGPTVAGASAAGIPGGGFASGGRPPVGIASLVGEHGPEVFVPDVAGTVVPNFAIKPQGSGGGMQQVHLSVALSDDLDARMDTRAENVSMRVVRQQSPKIVSESVAATRASASEYPIR